MGLLLAVIGAEVEEVVVEEEEAEVEAAALRVWDEA